jgi:type IV pilus assembly protein PilA
VSRDEGGFTLVELMVVVLIISILIAIAIPTFFGLKRRADDVAAKQAVALAVKTARSLSEDGTYVGVSAASLTASQPGLTFVDGGVDSSGPSVVSQLVVGSNVFVTSSFSRAGACFFIWDDIDAGSQYGTLDPAVVADCNAANNGAVAFGSSW